MRWHQAMPAPALYGQNTRHMGYSWSRAKLLDWPSLSLMFVPNHTPGPVISQVGKKRWRWLALFTRPTVEIQIASGNILVVRLYFSSGEGLACLGRQPSCRFIFLQHISVS